MKLKDYASIRTGLVLSRKEAKSGIDCFEYQVLSLKNVGESGQIRLNELEEYCATERLKKEYFAKKDDILLRLISPYTAVYITEKEEGILVPAHFAIIRVSAGIEPRYLHWWLGKMRKKFYQMASGGTAVGTISAGYIAEMPFNPPSIDKQQIIANIYELSQREQILLSSLTAKKKQLSDAVLTEFIRRGEITL